MFGKKIFKEQRLLLLKECSRGGEVPVSGKNEWHKKFKLKSL